MILFYFLSRTEFKTTSLHAHVHTDTDTLHIHAKLHKLRFTYAWTDANFRDFVYPFFICLRIHKYICNVFYLLYAYIGAYHTLSISSHLITRERINAVGGNVVSPLDNLHNILSLSTHLYIFTHYIDDQLSRMREREREKERAKESERERESEREMNLRGRKVKKSAFFKEKKRRSFRFCINLLYNIICIHSIFLIYNYIILLHARRAISAVLYMYIYVPFARANGNYYESFVTIPYPNLSYNASEIFASDRQ